MKIGVQLDLQEFVQRQLEFLLELLLELSELQERLVPLRQLLELRQRNDNDMSGVSRSYQRSSVR